MKAKYIIIILILIIAVTLLGIYIMRNSYILQFKLNWDIKLPKPDQIIYKKEKEASFNGDGEQYFIYEYTNMKKLERIKNGINWQLDKNIQMENEIIKILEYMGISEDLYPDFNSNYLYSYKKEENFTSIYLLYINNQLYIIEQMS